MWYFSASICFNNKDELLMVLQAAPGEVKKWTVPSGRKKENEDAITCCVRETYEETGYTVKVINKVFDKPGRYKNITYRVDYFICEVIGGEIALNDPDGLIYDVKWISKEKLKTLLLSFPEDREALLSFYESH